VTCLTVQDTRNVYNSAAVDAGLIAEQLECLYADTPFHAIKTGALGNGEIVDVLVHFLNKHKIDVPLITDPVIKAAGGGDLADEALIERMRTKLFALADVITPNGIELSMLGGHDDPAQSAEALLDAGCHSVLATGGHGTGQHIINTLYRQGQAPGQWPIQRIGGEYHGTGCTLAAAIAAGRAEGLMLEEAIERAQEFVQGAITSSLKVGEGQPVPDRSFKGVP
jgi:hydroxymethylpyrimidine/phosphomethylpyrimidine kinase